jgi:hypothetical protein
MKKTMFFAMALTVMVSFLTTAQAGVLLDKADVSKFYASWKTAAYDLFGVEISYSGSGTINLNNKFVLFPIVPPMLFGGVKAEAGKEVAGNTWEKIDGSVSDGENGAKTFKVTAVSERGIKSTITLETTRESAISNCKVESIDAADALTYRYETAILNYCKLSAIPFTVTLENGETVSGDLCQDFKPVKNIKTFELNVENKIFKIELDGIRAEITPRNNPTVAAGISLYPIIKGDKLMPGGSYSFKIKAQLADAENKQP